MNAVIDLKTQPVKVAAPGKQLAAGEVNAVHPEDCSFASVLWGVLTGFSNQEMTLTQPGAAMPETSSEAEPSPDQPEETALDAAGLAAQIWDLLPRPVFLNQETPERVIEQSGKETLPVYLNTEKDGLSTLDTAVRLDSMGGPAVVEALPDATVMDFELESYPDAVLDLESFVLSGDQQQEVFLAVGTNSTRSDQADAESDTTRDQRSSRGQAVERMEPQTTWTSDWQVREMAAAEQAPLETHASRELSRPDLDWEHLVTAMTLDKQPDGQRLTVRLRPDEMGQLEILFEQTDQGLSARIVADNPETSQWLGSQVQNLQASLAEKGIACTSIDVVYTQSAFSQDSPFQKQQGQASPEDPGSRQRRGQGGHSIPNQNESGGQATSPPVRHPISSYIDRWT